jgi:hypothetical protein
MTHTCNPSYSGVEIKRIEVQSQPGHSSKEPSPKNPSQKRAGGVAQAAGPEFKPQYW